MAALRELPLRTADGDLVKGLAESPTSSVKTPGQLQCAAKICGRTLR